MFPLVDGQARHRKSQTECLNVLRFWGSSKILFSLKIENKKYHFFHFWSKLKFLELCLSYRYQHVDHNCVIFLALYVFHFTPTGRNLLTDILSGRSLPIGKLYWQLTVGRDTSCGRDHGRNTCISWGLLIITLSGKSKYFVIFIKKSVGFETHFNCSTPSLKKHEL